VTGLGHVFSDDGYKARLLRPLVRNLIKAALDGKCSRLILQNKDDVETFVCAELATKEQIHLIMSSGVDTTQFQPANGSRELPGMRVLLASRLLWDKGIREYMEAARQIHAQGLPVEFLLAGSPDPGNPGSVTSAEALSWQQAGVVTYLGHVSDMPRLLSRIDAMVLPSYYGEGVPRCLLEAAASGLPIVTTNEPGCREIVVDRSNGLLVPARDAAALAAAIRFLYENPAERLRMGAAGRYKVLQEFDQQIVFDKTFSVYQELLASSH
jgi:glycosyltransferase involved in cell wall biosynthesis